MSLTDQEKQLVIDSFAKVAPISEQAAEIFYNRLFEVAPDTQSLFASTDIKEQGRKLMQTLSVAVGALYKLETIVPAIQDLGKRHISYGVMKEHYTTVGEALIYTLEQGLGNDFTDDVRTAWVKVYTLLAEVATQAYETVEA